MHSFADQVWKITESSYPVSLNILDGILKSEQDSFRYQSFAISNPCSVQKLAIQANRELLLGGQSLNVIVKLARSRTFANALIESNSEVLNYIINTSKSNGFRNDAYFELAILLLSNPLPSIVPLPTSAEPLFLCIVSESYKTPSVETCWRLYDILSGACEQLPGLLPGEVLTDVESQLVRVVKRPDLSPREQDWSLACLGILACLHQVHSDSRPRSPTEQFFSASSNKAFSTLSLAALQAVFNGKLSGQIPVKDACKRLDAAIRIVQQTSQDTRQIWAVTKVGKESIRRLRKCLATEADIHPDLRMRLFILFSYVQQPTPSVLSDYTVFVSHMIQIAENQVFDMLCMEKLVNSYAKGIEVGTVRGLLDVSIQALDNPVSQPLSVLKLLTIQMSVLGKAAARSISIINAILEWVAAHEGSALRLLETEDQAYSCSTTTPCNRVIVSHKCKLKMNLIETLIIASCTVEQGTATRDWQIENLVSYLKTSASKIQECDPFIHKSIHESIYPSLVQPTMEPIHEYSSWQDKVNHFIQREAAVKAAATESLVRDICGTLVDAETPLREERERTATLEQRLVDSSNMIKTLKSNVMDRDVVITELQNDKIAASQCQSQLQLENSHLRDIITALEQRVIEVDTAMQGQVEALEKAINDQVLDFKARETTADVRIETLTEQIVKFETDKLRIDEQRISDLQDSEELKDKMGRLEQVLDDNSAESKRQDTIIDALNEANDKLVKDLDLSDRQIETLSVQVADAALQSENLRQKHVADMAAKELEMQQVQNNHDRDMETMRNDFHRRESTLKSRLDDAFSAFQEEKGALLADIDHKDAILHSLNQDVEHLNKYIKQQDTIIDSLRSMRHVSGPPSVAAQKQCHTKKQSRASSAVPETPRLNSIGFSRRRSERGSRIEKPNNMSIVAEHEEEIGISLKSSKKRANVSSKASDHLSKRFKLQEVRDLDLVKGDQDGKAQSLKPTSPRMVPLTDVTTKRGNDSPVKVRQADEKGKPSSLDSFGLSSIELESIPPESSENRFYEGDTTQG